MFSILHVSDTHIGTQYDSEKRRRDYREAFMESIDIGKERNIDLIIHSGDLFDSPNPSIEEFSDCIDVLSNIEGSDIEMRGIVGNHERKRNQQWLDIYEKFNMCSRLNKKPEIFEKNGLKIALYGIDAVRSPWWNEVDLELEDTDADYKILSMHELVHPPVPEKLADYNLEEIFDRIGINIDLLLMGDYHEKKITEVDGTKVIYPGSTEKTSINESKDHYVYIYELGDNIKQKQIKLSSPRPVLNVKVPLSKRDGLERVSKEVNSTFHEGNRDKEPILVVNLEGENEKITPREIRKEYKDDYSIIRVRDNRKNSNFSNIDVDLDKSNISQKIEDKVKKSDFSNETLQLREEIEDKDLSKSLIRDRTREILKEGEKNEN